MIQRVAVIGFGSAGCRHARVIAKLGVNVAVVSSQSDIPYKHFSSVEVMMQRFNPDYIVVANITSAHYETLLKLRQLGYDKYIMVEKPVFEQYRHFNFSAFQGAWIAYNLRFHPLLEYLHRFVQENQIITVYAYVGQYLPSWRQTQDYRFSYSAHKSQGGGVLRDLSHELDYLTWIFGQPLSIAALGGKISSLEINSDDTFSVICKLKRCSIVSLHMNYLDHVSTRYVKAISHNKTFYVDFIKNIYSISSDALSIDIDPDYTYMKQHKAVINQEYDKLCPAVDGVNIVSLIEQIEKASIERKWINL